MVLDCGDVNHVQRHGAKLKEETSFPIFVTLAELIAQALRRSEAETPGTPALSPFGSMGLFARQCVLHLQGPVSERAHVRRAGGC